MAVLNPQLEAELLQRTAMSDEQKYWKAQNTLNDKKSVLAYLIDKEGQTLKYANEDKTVNDMRKKMLASQEAATKAREQMASAQAARNVIKRTPR